MVVKVIQQHVLEIRTGLVITLEAIGGYIG